MAIANIKKHLKTLAETDEDKRSELVEALNIQNYGLNFLSENEIWVLRSAAENAEYLGQKLKEADELSLDVEAPSEEDELSLDPAPEGETPATGGEELSLDPAPEGETPATGGEELSLDPAPEGETPATGGEELSLDPAPEGETPAAAGGEELSLDPAPEATPETETTSPEIETSLEGAGILPLLAQIQDALASGKPSEVELAALKAMKKMF